MFRKVASHIVIAATLGILALALPAPVQAQISFVDMFRSGSATQTGNGNTLTPDQFFLSLGLTSVNAGDFATVTATYPGPGSPVNLPQVSPTFFQFQTGFFPTQADMDAAFPFGTYAFSATGGAAPDAATSFDYTADDYPTAQPFLTGTDFADLQGVHADAPITVHFSPFATDPVANSQFTFFTIFDTTASLSVFDAGFLPASTTSVTISANTLAAGHSFVYELINSNRVLLASPNAQFPAQIGFDLRTTGTFQTAAAGTAAPEPGSLALFALALLPVAGIVARRYSRP